MKFATKPQLARRMIERAVTAQVPFAGVAGDEACGDNGPLRSWLEQQHIAYVLAVACDHRAPAGAGRTIRTGQLAARLPRPAWQQLSAGNGAKGRRHCDWAWATISHPGPGHRYLLIRRNRHTGDLAFCHCYAPDPVPLPTLVSVAGLRWTIEENLQASKGIAGLDEHQVRRWTSWHRWVTLAILAAAVLTITAALESLRTPAPAGQIPLTRNQIAHLFASLTTKHPRPQPPDPMVKLATTPPAPRQNQPLPAASSPRPMNVTIYGWSTRPLLGGKI